MMGSAWEMDYYADSKTGKDMEAGFGSVYDGGGGFMFNELGGYGR